MNIVDENLAKTCVLVSISLSRWQGRKTDMKAAEKLAEEAKANRKSVYVGKRLVSEHHCPSFKAIQKLDGHIRNNIFYRRCAPTQIINTRIATSASLNKFIAELDQSFDKRAELIDKLVEKEYPAFLDIAQDYMGDRYDDADFPTPAQVRAKYAATRNFTPLADSNPALVGFPEEVANSIAEEAGKQHDYLREIAQDSLAPRLYQALSDFIVAMNAFSVIKVPDGEGSKDKRINPFRDSKLSNVTDRAEDCIDLDLSIDRKLSAFASKLFVSFQDVEAEGLRELTSFRVSAVEKAEAFINEMIDLELVDSEQNSKRAKDIAPDADVYVPEIDEMLDDVVDLGF